MDSSFTPLEISSDLISITPCRFQDKKLKEECGFESETDANYSSISSRDDDNESVADSDSFFNIREALNQEEDNLEDYSYITGGEMSDVEEDNTATNRGVIKEKQISEDKLESFKDEDEEEEMIERNRNREADKAFWEACLASGF
jgi:hypothetical protein